MLKHRVGNFLAILKDNAIFFPSSLQFIFDIFFFSQNFLEVYNITTNSTNAVFHTKSSSRLSNERLIGCTTVTMLCGG